MLNNPFFLFGIGNLIGFIGVVPLIIRVYKNRKGLAGYDMVGSALTLSSILFFLLGFISARDIINTILISFTFLYWFMVVFFKVKNR